MATADERLKITKPDGSVHLIPHTRLNRDFQERQNALYGPELANRISLVKVNDKEEETHELDIIHAGSTKITLSKKLVDKDDEIARLKAELAEARGESKAKVEKELGSEAAPSPYSKWGKAKVEKELELRGLSTEGEIAEMKARLTEFDTANGAE